MSMTIPTINWNRMSSAENKTPNVRPGPFLGDVSAAPFITLVNHLFGTQGPLANFKLVAFTAGKPGQQPFFTIDVQGAWRPEVKALIEATINKATEVEHASGGWTFTVVDSSNLELPQMQSAPKS